MWMPSSRVTLCRLFLISFYVLWQFNFALDMRQLCQQDLKYSYYVFSFDSCKFRCNGVDLGSITRNIMARPNSPGLLQCTTLGLFSSNLLSFFGTCHGSANKISNPTTYFRPSMSSPAESQIPLPKFWVLLCL